jgi:hypothetical protein
VKHAPEPFVHHAALFREEDAREVDPVFRAQRRATRVEQGHAADEARPAGGDLGGDPAAHGVPRQVRTSRRHADHEPLGDVDQLGEEKESAPWRRP